MVRNTEVNMAEGQYERSIGDAYTNENESVIYAEEEKDSIESEMLMSIKERTMPMGVSDVPTADDSSDLGSFEFNGADGLCDGGLATADLQPGHLSIIQVDRGMMMNVNEAELVHSKCAVGAEHGGDRALMPGSQANHGWAASLQGPCHPPRTS